MFCLLPATSQLQRSKPRALDASTGRWGWVRAVVMKLGMAAMLTLMATVEAHGETRRAATVCTIKLVTFVLVTFCAGTCCAGQAERPRKKRKQAAWKNKAKSFSGLECQTTLRHVLHTLDGCTVREFHALVRVSVSFARCARAYVPVACICSSSK